MAVHLCSSRWLLSLILITFVLRSQCGGHNKYSADMNQNKSGKVESERPFRMNKINILWEKAQKRLGPEKLKSLYSDLKIQDKDELTLKHLRATGGDKEGLKEAELRRHFKAIMENYDLGEQLEHVEEAIKHQRMHDQPRAFNEASEEEINKRLFKDKKLNKLWEKAEKSGFTEEELLTLKEELGHHQEKLDEYHSLMDELNKELHKDDNYENSLDRFVDDNVDPKIKNVKETSQLLKEKHENLKQSYEKISRITAGGSDGGFEEFKVQELWKLAKQAKFDPEELQSLKQELQHYEHRIKKLKHLQSQADFHGVTNDKWLDKHKPEDQKYLEQRIKQYEHKVEKVHGDLHSRIMQKHLEL